MSSETKNENSGVQAIVMAILHNPAAAFQIASIIAGLFFIYYSTQYSIAELKAQATHDHADVTNSMTDIRGTQASNAAQFKLDLSDANNRIAGLDVRGTQRYGELKDTLSSLQQQMTRIDTNVEWIIRQVEDGKIGNGYVNNDPFPRRDSPPMPRTDRRVDDGRRMPMPSLRPAP